MNIESKYELVQLIYLISIFNGVILGLAIAAFFQNRRSSVNKSFSFYLVILIFWTNFVYLYSFLFYMPHVFLPLSIIAGSLLSPGFYLFSRHLTEESYKVKKQEYAGLIPLAVIVLYNILHLFDPRYREMINDIIKVADGQLFRKADWSYYLYTAYVIAGIIFGLFIIFKKIRIEKRQIKRNQLIFIIITITVGYISNIVLVMIKTILNKQVNLLTSVTIIMIALLLIGFSLLRNKAWTVEHMMELVEKQDKELSESYDKLKAIDKTKSDFFTNLSHEMKTPLTLISNYMDKYLENHTAEEEISIIKNNIDKLLEDMINFFDIQKLDRGLALYENNKIIDLSSTVKQKLDLYKSMVSKMGITISQDIENSIFIKADSAAVERIINNLMNNAVRYNKQDGNINVVLSGSENNTTLSIKDTGIGIAEDDIIHIFEPYYQVSHKKKNIQGIGMGLSIVNEIIKSINGNITVNSKPGEGTEFIIALDRYHVKEGDEISRENLSLKPVNNLPFYNRHIQESSNKNNINVLVVEDNTDLLHLVLDKLSGKYNVFGASNGTAALNELETIPVPDVIISDIMMDEMDGIELCKTILNDSRFSDIPFIFLTARSRIEDKIEGLNTGAIDYIYKPFVLDELISKIDAVIRYRELKKNLFEKDKFTSLGMLLGGISHEIFNPLSGITAPLENIEKMISESGMETPANFTKYTNQIRISAEKIHNTINKIKLLYSDNPAVSKEVSLLDAVNFTIADFIKEYKDIDYILKIEAGLKIMANPGAFKIILTNLLSNASEALNGKGKILISAVKEKNTVFIKVEDDGPGIPPEDADTVFDAFYTTKNTGMGLGLNIVKNLCLKQGWDIRVISEKNKGTIFTISTESI